MYPDGALFLKENIHQNTSHSCLLWFLNASSVATKLKGPLCCLPFILGLILTEEQLLRAPQLRFLFIEDGDYGIWFVWFMWASSRSLRPSRFWPDGLLLKVNLAPLFSIHICHCHRRQFTWKKSKHQRNFTLQNAAHIPRGSSEVPPASERLWDSSSTIVGRLDNYIICLSLSFSLSVCLCAYVCLSTHLFTVYSLTLSGFPGKINNS